MSLSNKFFKSCSLFYNGTGLLIPLEARNLAFITVETISKHKTNSFICYNQLLMLSSDSWFTIHTIQTVSISSHFPYFPLGTLVFTKPEFHVHVMARLQSDYFRKSSKLSLARSHSFSKSCAPNCSGPSPVPRAPHQQGPDAEFRLYHFLITSFGQSTSVPHLSPHL